MIESRVRGLLAVGRNKDAIALARQTLSEGPEDPSKLLSLACALVQDRQDKEGLAVVERALALAPDDPSGHFFRGLALRHLGRFRDSMEAFEEAIRLEPESASSNQALVETGIILLDLRSEKPYQSMWRQRTLVAARRAVDLAPDDAASHLVMAKALMASGDRVSARKSAEKALSIQPNNAVGHQILGLLAQAEGNFREAGERFVSAGKANPKSGTSLALLKNLRVSVPVVAIGISLAIRLLRNLGREKIPFGVILVVSIVLVLGWLAFSLWGQAWLARRRLSPEAKEILAKNRRLQ